MSAPVKPAAPRHPEIERFHTWLRTEIREGTAKLEERVREYLKDYEYRGDDADHRPTETEAALIADAVAGLLADEEFGHAFFHVEERRQALRGTEAVPAP